MLTPWMLLAYFLPMVLGWILVVVDSMILPGGDKLNRAEYGLLFLETLCPVLNIVICIVAFQLVIPQVWEEIQSHFSN